MRRLLALTCLALACETPASTSTQTAPAAPSPAPAPVVDPQPAAPAPAGLPLADVGPGGAVGREPRRQAVLDLLADGRSAAALTELSAEAEHPFDPGLADALTPRVLAGVPIVRQAKATVSGPLDPDIVRRIVRAHINEVRYCYNQGLARDPRAEGRVVVDFEIRLTGDVETSKITESTMTDPQVPECIAKAVRRWKFPRPKKLVQVSYPFVLMPG